MSKEHENAAIGDAVAARKEARTELAKLDAERDTIAATLQGLANTLKTAPEGIAFEKQSLAGGYAVAFVLDPAILDADRIKRLVDRYRELQTKLRDAKGLIERFDQA